jgi:hypothetical protein
VSYHFEKAAEPVEPDAGINKIINEVEDENSNG